MKILHTADWHLGKVVNGFSRLDDQSYSLNLMLDEIADDDIDAIIMAGDLYDRVNPSQETLALANELITRIVDEMNIPLLMIAGNHDNPQLLEYGRPLFAKEQFYVEGQLKNDWKPVSIGPADFWLLPFADPETGRAIYGEDSIKDYEDLASYQVERIQSRMNPQRLNVLIYHGYIIYEHADSIVRSDSERPLAVGNADLIPAEIFSAFDYVALGHLHQGQKVMSEQIRYSGSPLKYSKSEAHHQKSYTLIDIDKNKLNIQKRPFKQKRDLKILKGYFKDVVQESSEDYVFIDLLDEHYVLDSMDRLQQAYPYLMGVSYIHRLLGEDHRQIFSKDRLEKKDLVGMFEDFYQHFHGHGMTEDQQSIVAESYLQVRKEEE